MKLAGREYESLLRRLRRQAPPRYPVRVVRRIDPDHPTDDGVCDPDPVRRRFVISLHPKLEGEALEATLVHERAHALAFSICYGHTHGPAWHAEYVRCWAIWRNRR